MQLQRSDIEAIAAILIKELCAVQVLPGRWLTLKEAMEYCKVKHPDTIRAWINNGYIYGHKRTGQWIIDRQSIDDWFESDKIR